MDFLPQNKIWTPIGHFIFSSQAGIQRSFQGEKSHYELYIEIREE